MAAELATVRESVDEVRGQGRGEGAVDVRADIRVGVRGGGGRVRAILLLPAAAAADPKKRPTQKSAANGPADDALTASTRLYRDARLPRTSPAIRILTAFGSDIASGLSGARELWREVLVIIGTSNSSDRGSVPFFLVIFPNCQTLNRINT